MGRGDAVVLTIALVYLGGWAITMLVTFVASRRLADGSTTPLSSVGFSLLAGLIWPLMVLGLVELSSVAACSVATSLRAHSGIPDSWLSGDVLDDVVVPLR
ncbi:MAG: hypothetical protein QOD90_4670 [Mycobacterium sp.]|jgi:hypothetical protein|nr:hypothetical protein [Mycobacterium sp.]